MRHPRVVKIVGFVFFGLCMAALVGLAVGLIVMWLWNAVMPSTFGLPVIGYWKAVGLFLLAHLLFKGVGGHHRGHHGWHGRGPCGESREHHAEIRAKVKEWLNGEDQPTAGGPEEPKNV